MTHFDCCDISFKRRIIGPVSLSMTEAFEQLTARGKGVIVFPSSFIRYLAGSNVILDFFTG